MSDTPRSLARRVLERVEKDAAWATLALAAELARTKLDERDRRLSSELVYGVLRHRRRLDHALAAHADLARTPDKILNVLRVAAYQLLYLDRIPAYAVVDDAVAAANVLGKKLGGFTNAVLRKVGKAGRGTPGALPLAIEYSMPDWVMTELASVLPPEALPAVVAAFAEQAPLVARANTRKLGRDALAAKLGGTPVASAPQAIVVDLGDPGKDPAFLAGEWTVQDTGAQLVANLAAPRDGMRILDACAGVGGKATHLAELANVAIDAADLSKTKLELLADTARRLGHALVTAPPATVTTSTIRPIACDLSDPAAPLAPTYDLIVLDAPCSGLGVLRRHPDAKWRAAPDLARMAHVQRQLLDAVIPRLAPNGALIYSVCTFTRAEGPDQIRDFAARHGLRVTMEHRTWPPDADAFYLARLER